jgi:hypothetical protein
MYWASCSFHSTQLHTSSSAAYHTLCCTSFSGSTIVTMPCYQSVDHGVLLSVAITAELSRCFTTLSSQLHNAQYMTDILHMSTKHLSNLGYEDYPYGQINVKTHHWTNNTENSLYGQLAPCNNNIIIIKIITNHCIQNPFSLKAEAPILSLHNVSYNVNKTGTACTISL